MSSGNPIGTGATTATVSTGNSGLAAKPVAATTAKRRSPLAHLLHALNQPLTGLQCSLELALAGPRRADDYIRILRAGVELTGRMRELVEAIRELTDMQEGRFAPKKTDGAGRTALTALLRETAADLLPVADAKNISLSLECEGEWEPNLDPHFVAVILFRLIDSAVALARGGTEIRLSARQNGAEILVTAGWEENAGESNAFSRPELGLLIAQAGWEQMGGVWDAARTGERRNCTARLAIQGRLQ